MTFEPSASQAQIDARQHAFDNQPDPATLVSREEIRAALLDRHTAATQDKLDAAHVAICGCGGLGSTIAVALTRIGVGHLHLIDFDRVDMTNLNRQQYFLKDLGQYKTEALRSNLRQINPFTDITIDTVKVTDENVPTLFENEDIICEAFDVPENKTMLVNAVLENLPGKKLVSASGMAGFRSSNLVSSRFEELLLLRRRRDGSGTGCRPDGAARGRGRLPRSEHDHATDPRRGRRLTHCYVTPLP